MRNNNFELFIKRSKEKHNNFYSYEKTVEPKSVKDKIIVTCPIHGDFETTFDTHVNKGCGCPKCSGVHSPSAEEFIEKVKKIHEGKNYDFSKTVYKNAKTKVIVTCHEKDIFGSEHGDFEIRPDHLRHGVGCPKCAHRYLTTEEVIEMAKNVHGEKYDYSLVEYHNDNSERLPIICHECDENGNEHGIFAPVWSSHLMGVGCPKCNGGVKFGKEKFIEDAKRIHGNKYNYDKFIYVNAKTGGIITCPRHGDFVQSPYLHTKMKRGCPKCKSSRLESIVINALNRLGIIYEYQVSVNGLSTKQTIDFYLPSVNTYIECQGEQHYTPVPFGKISLEESTELFNKRVELDSEKYNQCTKNGSKIIYFTDPKLFHTHNIDVFSGFYSDKIVFTNINDLIDFIPDAFGSADYDVDVVNRFMTDLRNIESSILVSGRKATIKNIAIFINPLTEEDSKTMYERRRAYIRMGYKVIEVFEDEYITNRDIVISKISYALGLSNNLIKINGRECNIIDIDKNTASSFLEKNHIQGFVNSTLYIGCVSKDGELVAVMTFTQEKPNFWNLTRYATKMGTLCRGVGSKMIKYFIKTYNPNEIKTFADKRWTFSKDANLYTKMGFTISKIGVSPDYKYWKNGVTSERQHKFGFRKQILHKKYGFPLTMTETEMTKKLGYVKVWDCGLYKYVWKNK